ncbi:hypothetical protein KK137_00020 [Croceibacterium sp. LX-88]|uniref:DUF4145 domain-containing protein n=1 Tax=Croceibacterium selenioxidans TaxID=2838833 RepID=A0ABS5VZ27_9SPHN|nr:hypothetical protein [Croceibacterium selenioxidans]MBT2132704.1 hypothetical protein [Croceibacterium selenioxidans]
MQPIHGYYLYELGAQVHPLTQFNFQATTWQAAHHPTLVAQGALGALLNNSVYQLRTSRQEGLELLNLLGNFLFNLPDFNSQGQFVPVATMWPVIDKATKFETVFKAELGVTPMFYVPPRHNVDMTGYLQQGHLSFPVDLATKVPEAILDAQQAARCIAYDLPTAAGFHLHRANESVLRRYFDRVAGPEHRPDSRNMGDYINKLSQLEKGDQRVRAALRDLKDLHRNPLMHPEEHISTTDDAISLMGGVRAAMSLMLKELPEPSPLTADGYAALLQSTGTDAHG